MNELRNGLSPTVVSGRIEMRTPDDVSAVLALKACGWGSKRIAAESGCSRNTVKRWLAEGGWCAAKTQRRPRALDGHEASLAERFRRHAGNADVVRQELAAELGITVSLRTVERAVAHLRQELRAEARATMLFETRPGQQLLLDNARALIQPHDPVSREVVVNPKLHAFARHWGFKVKACAPYRARSSPVAAIGPRVVHRAPSVRGRWTTADGQGRARRRLREEERGRRSAVRELRCA